MSCEGFLVLSMCLRFFVERSEETSATWHGVVVPLLCFTGEECVRRKSLFFAVAGGAVMDFSRGGPATRKERRQASNSFSGF